MAEKLPKHIENYEGYYYEFSSKTQNFELCSDQKVAAEDFAKWQAAKFRRDLDEPPSVDCDDDGDGAVVTSISEGRTVLAEPDWRTGAFRYTPQTPFQATLYALMRNSRLAKVCEFRDCPAPYFVAKDPRQRYCEADCAEKMQVEWRRRWWKDHGNDWRKKRKKSKEKTSLSARRKRQ